MHLASPLAVAALIALPGASLPQGTEAPSNPALERHRDVLTRIAARDEEGCYVVLDEDVARIAREIEQAIHVPPSWRVLLRHAGNEYSIPTKFDTSNGMLWTALVDRSGRELGIRLMLDAQWVIVGGALFIGPDGTTEFTRAQFRERTGFFPLRAIPIVLDRLETELQALPLADADLKYVGLESAQPLGDSPWVHCVLSLEDKGLQKRTKTELNGVIPLPAAAAHDKDFRFAGSQGVGDTVIGPVTSTKSLDQVFREARAMGQTIQSSGEWSTHIFHNNGSDSFPTFVTDLRQHRAEERYDDFRIDSAGFVGDTEELSASVAGVPLSALGLRLLLTSIAAAYDPGKQDIFLVLGSADRHEIDVMFTSTDARPPTVRGVTSLRLVFDAAGSKIDHVDGVAVREILRKDEGEHSRWTCRFGDGRVADVWVHEPVMCANGVDLRSRCRIGDAAYDVAGGIAETTLRGE